MPDLEFAPAAELQREADAYAADIVAPLEEELAETKRQLLACQASTGSGLRPTIGTPGQRYTVASQADADALSGKLCLSPIHLTAPTVEVDDVHQDITVGLKLAGVTNSISMDANRVVSARLSRLQIRAEDNPRGFAYGLNGDAFETYSCDVSGVVDGINVGTTGGFWEDHGSSFHDLAQLPAGADAVHANGSHTDAAAFNRAGGISLYGTTLDAGPLTVGGSLACLMLSPGPVTSLRLYGVLLLGGYPAINVNNQLAEFPLILQRCLFGPSTFPGGCAIIAPKRLHPAITAALQAGGSTMWDGSPVKIANGG